MLLLLTSTQASTPAFQGNSLAPKTGNDRFHLEQQLLPPPPPVPRPPQASSSLTFPLPFTASSGMSYTTIPAPQLPRTSTSQCHPTPTKEFSYFTREEASSQLSQTRPVQFSPYLTHGVNRTTKPLRRMHKINIKK